MAFAFPGRPPKIHIEGTADGYKKDQHRKPIHHSCGKIQPQPLPDHIVDKRGRQVVLTQCTFHLPVPVGQEAVAPAIIYAQAQPGEQGKARHQRMRPAGLRE